MSLKNEQPTGETGGRETGNHDRAKRPEEEQDTGGYGWLKRAGIYYALCMEMAFSIAGATVIGWWLDSKFGTTPWLTIALLILGVVAAIKFLLVLLWRLGGTDDARGDM